MLTLAAACSAQPEWDLLIRNGHVIDPKNSVDRVADIAIQRRRIVRVAANLPPSHAKTVVDANGLYVTPGLIDPHVHVYAGTGVRALAGDDSVYPDGFSFRSGVTTMVDAGTAGWRNFLDFRQRVIDRAKTRVLAFVNIVADGMSPVGEDDPALMNAEEVAKIAKANADVVVGFKTAHYAGPGWHSIDSVVEAGKLANLPVMIDFGYTTEERTLKALLEARLRPGDIYTHCYSGNRDELLENGKLNPAMLVGRKRGILFDVGHGAGSFYWNIAVPAIDQGFLPDTISTDLHTSSMNAGMKDLLNVMSKLLNLGVPLEEVVRMTTWNSAKAIRRTELGHLSEGADADVAVLRVEKGHFGFVDSAGARKDGDRRIVAEMTVRRGSVVWDLSGLSSQDWKQFQYKKRAPRP